MPIHAAPDGRTFYAGLLDALTNVMGLSNDYLRTHGRRVAVLARQLGRAFGLSDREVAELMFAAILADVGMIGLAEDAWETPTNVLDEDTRLLVRSHPDRSATTAEAIPHLGRISTLIRHHHEWFDGSGYPGGAGAGMAGDAIPLGARILRLADTVIALASDRPHRPALDFDRIEAIVREFSGVEFCPAVTKAYLDLRASGVIARFEEHAFHRHVARAAAQLVPEDVTPLSSDQLLEILASIIDAKDPYTAGHSRRVAIYAVAMGEQLGLDARLRETLWPAGYLHDLGKLAVPLRVLASPGKLDDDERALVQSHTTRGADILGEIPSLRHLRTGARYHHENWDGSGYPEGLSGDQIPLVPRILAVADAYDAMTSGRAYRRGRRHEEAITEVSDQAGRQFCPDCAAAFVSLPSAFFTALRNPAEWKPEPVADPARRATRTAWRYL